MFCTKCGNTLDENAKFCTYCGEINPQTNNDIPLKNNYNNPYMANQPQMYSSNQNQPFNNIQGQSQFNPDNMQGQSQFNSGNMQGQPQFNPNNMQGQPQFNPNNMQGQPQFNPNNMQEQPQFNSGNMQQAPPPMYNYSQAYSASKTSTKKNNTAIIIVIISVLVLAITATVLFFIFKDKLFGKKEENRTDTLAHNADMKKSGENDSAIQDLIKDKIIDKKDKIATSDDSKTDSYYDKNNSDSDIDYNNRFENDYDSDEYETDYDNESEPVNDGYGYNNYILSGSDTRYISKNELYGLSAEECKIARNELYARHGRLFKDSDLQDYFNNCNWYYGDIEPEDFDESVFFNKYEIANRDLIIKYEKEMGYR